MFNLDVFAICISIISLTMNISNYIRGIKEKVRVNLVLSEHQLHYNYYDILIENLTNRNIQNFKIECENIEDIRLSFDKHRDFLGIFDTVGTLPIGQQYRGIFFEISKNEDLENVKFKISYIINILGVKFKIKERITIPIKNLHMLHIEENMKISEKTTYKVINEG